MIERAGGCVYFLTDYGLKDEFAGVLKSVVARFAPGAVLVDLTHGVPAFDVRAGALALARAVPYLGPGVVLAVVDPGVAGDRRAVALEVASESASESGPASGSAPRSSGSSSGSESGPSHLVGPDNGLLMWAADALGGVRNAVALGGGPSRSTFDGRDVFAPAAASLWRGTPLADIGEPFDPDSLVRLVEPFLSVSPGSGEPGSVEAEVLWVDTFGNVQLSAKPEDAVKAGVGDRAGEDLYVITPGASLPARRVTAFCDVADGGLGLVVDSNGHLALAGDRVSAALTLGLRAGDHVTLVSTLPTDPGGARVETRMDPRAETRMDPRMDPRTDQGGAG